MQMHRTRTGTVVAFGYKQNDDVKESFPKSNALDKITTFVCARRSTDPRARDVSTRGLHSRLCACVFVVISSW